MSNVILGNKFYFGSIFFGATWTISSMGKKRGGVEIHLKNKLKVNFGNHEKCIVFNHFCN
jgi:hypothetical protein